MCTINKFFDHPVYKKICENGIGSQNEWHRTFLIYMDLVECREWYNVVLYPLKQLKLLLVAGHVTTTDNRCFVLPMSTNDSLSPSQIQTVTDAVKAVSSTARLMVGIVSSDATVVYYTLTDGLVAPEPVDDQNTVKRKPSRRKDGHKTWTVQ